MVPVVPTVMDIPVIVLPEDIPSILAALVIFVAVPVLWMVEWKLWRRSFANPNDRGLRSDALSAVYLSCLVSVFALVFLNNGMDTPMLEPFETMILTRSTVFASVIPAGYWLWVDRQK